MNTPPFDVLTFARLQRAPSGLRRSPWQLVAHTLAGAGVAQGMSYGKWEAHMVSTYAQNIWYCPHNTNTVDVRKADPCCGELCSVFFIPTL